MQGGATGTGTVTVLAPSTSTDRTLTLPDSTGTVATAESTLVQFNASGSAPVYACRAWVNFNGTGTVAIRASGNVTSITDNGTGDYTVNMTTAMQDVNFGAVTTASGTTFSSFFEYETYTRTTTTYRLRSSNSAGTLTDRATICVSIFR